MIQEHQARTQFVLTMDTARQHARRGGIFLQNALMEASKAVGIATVLNDERLMQEAASLALSLTTTSSALRAQAEALGQ